MREQVIEKGNVIKNLEDAVHTLESLDFRINQDTEELDDNYCDYALLELLGLQPLCKSLVYLVGGQSSSTGEVEPAGFDLKTGSAVNTSSGVEGNDSNLEPSLTFSNDTEEDPISEEMDASETVNTESKTSWDAVINAFWTDDTQEGTSKNVEEEDDLLETQREKHRSAFYAENYTLYELFDFYSKFNVTYTNAIL